MPIWKQYLGYRGDERLRGDRRRRVRAMQMSLFYAACDALDPRSSAVGNVVNGWLSGRHAPPERFKPLVRAYFKTLRDPRSYAQRIIARIDPLVHAPGVEASMRLQYSTLDHLSRAAFVHEIALARDCERADPGYLRRAATSYGC